MTPVSTSLAPNQKPLSNLSANHTIFECHWDQSKMQLEIYRLRNLLNKNQLLIASSKSQMTQQLKPIRLKHGTPNPSKALLLRLSVPQQLIHLTFEEGHSFIDRQLLERERETDNHHLGFEK